MRNELKLLDGERNVFTGEFVRFGTKQGYMGIEKTILLKNIKNSLGEVVTDHLWFNFTKGFSNIESQLVEGVEVEFTARVKQYTKGYKGYRDDVYKPIEVDYKLSHPTKIKIK